MLVTDIAAELGIERNNVPYRARKLGLPVRRIKSLDDSTPDRVCTKCGATKPIGEFYFRADTQKHMSVCSPCRGLQMTVWRRRARFNVSPERWDTMLAEQHGGCAICGTKHGENGRALQIDHDHQCCSGDRSCGDCVRGLLCESCNLGLGKLGDTYNQLWYALAYLAYHEDKPMPGVDSRFNRLF